MANPTPRDVRAVTKAVADPGVAGALVGLVERGCDREELLRLLARLRHAVVASRRETKQLRKLTRTLERASSGLADLPQWRESAHLGLPDDARTWLLDCSHDLQLLAVAIRARLAADETPHADIRIDRAKNRIVRYVTGQTGHPRDVEVATLIDAVVGSGTYTVDGHVQWRNRFAQAS